MKIVETAIDRIEPTTKNRLMNELERLMKKKQDCRKSNWNIKELPFEKGQKYLIEIKMEVWNSEKKCILRYEGVEYPLFHIPDIFKDHGISHTFEKVLVEYITYTGNGKHSNRVYGKLILPESEK
jgi:hypothetical protein